MKSVRRVYGPRRSRPWPRRVTHRASGGWGCLAWILILAYLPAAIFGLALLAVVAFVLIRAILVALV